MLLNFFSKKKKEPNFEDFPAIGGLMVSKMVVDDNIKPGFMYREKRNRPEDSGWRIFTGLESEDYTGDPNNVGIYNPSTILKIDPSIADILLMGVGSVYERASEKTEWYKVTDFELEDDYIVKHKLSDNWIIEINNLFERIIEDNGDLLYTTDDKSVRLAIWDEKDKSKHDIYKEHKATIENRDQSIATTLNKFEFTDDEVLRTGFLIKEADGKKEYHVLYSFSIVDNQVIQSAFYFDDLKDLEWAIDTWKAIQIE